MSTEKGLAGQTNQQDAGSRGAMNQGTRGRRALVVGLGISGSAAAFVL